MQWQDALLADTEALDDFYSWAAREIGFARDAMDTAIEQGNLQSAASAKGRKDALMTLTDALAAVEKEGPANGRDRRQTQSS